MPIFKTEGLGQMVSDQRGENPRRDETGNQAKVDNNVVFSRIVSVSKILICQATPQLRKREALLSLNYCKMNDA